jgi:hypothetical protein
MQIDSDKAVMVTFKHDDKLQENSECGFQVMMKQTGCCFYFPCLIASLVSNILCSKKEFSACCSYYNGTSVGSLYLSWNLLDSIWAASYLAVWGGI